VYPTPRDAATVILLRPAAAGFEVFLLRRRKNASFMGGAFVFPGGAVDGDDGGDLRVTAARELFEEAGVLLVSAPVDPATVAALRTRLLGGAPLSALLPAAGLALAPERLTYYAHWITPSVEGKRFSARFYLAALPAGQRPSFDAQETVDQAWVTPIAALARAQELALPPPQVRVLADLSAAATVDDALALAAVAARHPHPIMPRMAPLAGGGFALLLPWDPGYQTDGTGDSAPMPADHPLAVGPSRFVLEDRTWKNIAAPTSTIAG
jgi:8-oxo-dGTP pyrophosphatase MutT (NUDIX family)